MAEKKRLTAHARRKGGGGTTAVREYWERYDGCSTMIYPSRLHRRRTYCTPTATRSVGESIEEAHALSRSSSAKFKTFMLDGVVRSSCPVNTRLQIQARGPHVSKGYHDNQRRSLNIVEVSERSAYFYSSLLSLPPCLCAHTNEDENTPVAHERQARDQLEIHNSKVATRYLAHPFVMYQDRRRLSLRALTCLHSTLQTRPGLSLSIQNR